MWSIPNYIYILIDCRACFPNVVIRDGDIAWKRFPYYWPFVRGIHRWPVSWKHFPTGGFHSQRAINACNAEIWWCFRWWPNKLLNKHTSRRWFKTLWRPCDATGMHTWTIVYLWIIRKLAVVRILFNMFTVKSHILQIRFSKIPYIITNVIKQNIN